MKATLLVCLLFIMAYQAYLAPYTKVEESFNLQATHDILHRVDRFDHLDFPGVVPRTFFGATLLSAIALPVVDCLPSLFADTLHQQLLVRLLLAGSVVLALGHFTTSIERVFGRRTAQYMLLLMCFTQFHFVFWASRTLPNTMALPWVLMGLSHWVLWIYAESSSAGRERCDTTTTAQQHFSWMIRYLTFTGVVFRFEVGLLLVCLLGCESLVRYFVYNISIWPLVKKSLKEMILTAVLSLALTVPLDSFLWEKPWYWPEGIVFYFNAIQNKSSEWGTLPFYAYFASFLPRLLLVAYPLAAAGFFSDIRLRRLLSPIILYVILFSFLPHKEWRFIFYTIPVFTAAAANVIHQIAIRGCFNKKKDNDDGITRTTRADTATTLYRVLLVAVLGGALASGLLAQFMFQISRLNYPGGEALRKLHQLEEHNSNVYVHLDADAAMTGASLYGQANPSWRYSKKEVHTEQQDYLNARYTHLITAHPERFDTSLLFDIIDVTYGLDKVSRKSLNDWKTAILEQWNIWPLEYEMAPKLYTLKLKEPQKQWILSTVQTYPVVMYSKSYCPYCRATKQLLSKYCDLKSQVHIIEVDHQKDGHFIKQALGQLTGRFTFPNVFKNGQSLGGFDNLSVLDREGKLKDICF